MKSIDLLSLDKKELENLFLSLGEKPFRAKQMFKFLHKEKGENIRDITVLSKDLRSRLEELSYVKNLQISERLDSKIDNTKKYIFKLDDGHIIETVYLESKAGSTLCLSSQVGCKMGCSFCASTKARYGRNLKASEILGQVYCVEKNLDTSINNIVLMGIGEPLDNYDNVLKFIRLINDEDGRNLGVRHITLSTCGIIEGIDKLADEGLQINLAVSLHNAIQEEREKIMPVAKSNHLDRLKSSLKNYQEKTGRRISYEYILLNNENDSHNHARALKKMCADLDAHVNLIRLNEVREYNGKRASTESLKSFLTMLENLNVKVTVRREQGSDIDAACGQLRNDYYEVR